MNDILIVWAYGIGFVATWAIMTAWYVRGAMEFDPSIGRVFIGGMFGLFGAVIWPIIWISLLAGMIAKWALRGKEPLHD